MSNKKLDITYPSTRTFIVSGSVVQPDERTLGDFDVWLHGAMNGGSPVTGTICFFDNTSYATATISMASAAGGVTASFGGAHVAVQVSSSNLAQGWATALASLINTATGSIATGLSVTGALGATIAPSGTLANWNVILKATEQGAASNLIPIAVAGTGMDISAPYLQSGSAGHPLNVPF